jgi:outer membrane protein OmpA-like peptidoglycan-associated protein
MKRAWVIGMALVMAIGAIAQQPATKKKRIKQKPVKHYIDVYAGGGISSFGYSLEGGQAGIGGSFTLGAGYTYFFKPYIGVQAGLQISRVATMAKLTEPIEWSTWQDGSPLTDYMGEQYIHRTTFANWKEKEQAYLFQIPVGLRFRYFKDRDSRAGLHAAVGLNLSIPLLSNYVHTSGDVTHTGWYPQWQLELHDLPGRFETEPFITPQEESLRSRLNTVNVEAYAELGTSIRLNVRTELFVAAYMQYMLNDFSSVKRDARTPLGFSNNHNHYAFMTEYRGLIGTDKVGALHPWVVGLKVGVSVSPIKTEREKVKQLKKLAKQFPDVLPPTEVHDTIYVFDTIYMYKHDTVQQVVTDTIRTERIIRDTVMIIKEQKAVEAIDSMLSESVIWFNLDEYEPILEPAYIIDSIAAVMRQHPNIRLHVNGHACRLGSDAYNQRLALKRAQAVAKLLREKGVSGERMQIRSYSSSYPYRYNNEHQLSKDRRVEIIPETDNPKIKIEETDDEDF